MYDDRDSLVTLTEADLDGPGPLLSPVSEYVYYHVKTLKRAAL